jgi:hypothetical protein
VNLNLKEKVGPLPKWAWGAGMVGAGVGYILWKRHKANAAATVASTATTTSAGSTAAGADTAVPAGDSGGGGYGYAGGSGYPVQVAPTTAAANAPTATHPYLDLADIADEQLAESVGIPQSWLAYVGSDPNASTATAANGYGVPTDLPQAAALPAGSVQAYGGLANKLAPAGAATVYGATRNGTPNAFTEWYQSVLAGGSGSEGFYVPQ